MAPAVTLHSAPNGEVAVAPPFSDWQREVLSELRAIRVALEQQRQQRPVAALSRADRVLLAKLLPVLGATYGGDGFTSRDCAEDDAPGLRLVLRQRSTKQIGKLLARADGIAVDGLMVRKQGTELHVTLWQVVAVS